MNNINYGYPSSNSSSFSSFPSQYSSTPSSNTRYQRPRFAYAGPPSYPRPRSSASKPNPDPYTGSLSNPDYSTNLRGSDPVGNQNTYPDNTDIRDYSHGYSDSMKNNYGDSTMNLNDSLSMNNSRDSYNNSFMSTNSSSYFTGNDSFYQSPQKPLFSSYPSENPSFGSPNRGGHSSYGVDDIKHKNTYYDSNAGGLSTFDTTARNQISEPSVRGFGGGFGTNTRGMFGASTRGLLGSFETNTRGKTGSFGTNRGNFRGRFQKKRPRGDKQSSATSMAAKWQCTICSIDFTSNIPLEMHLRGAKHAKKLKTQTALHSIQGQITQVKEIEKPDGKKFFCEICNIIANSSLQLQMHLEGTKHKAKLQQLQEPKDESKDKEKEIKKAEVINGKSNGGVVRPAPADFDQPQPAKMFKFSCDICSIVVNSEVQLQQHLTSKKHQAKVEGKPIIKKRKAPPAEGEAAQPMEQAECTSEETKTEITNVVGVKTLSASFVQGGTLQ